MVAESSLFYAFLLLPVQSCGYSHAPILDRFLRQACLDQDKALAGALERAFLIL